ncbi:MAG TPA: response regulator transcription factor [Candidatus Acidoferrum sp.]|jgi:two-component system response regulator NreC|nr:response regulator transcription factor [Candidatus Acidoferrum sp.]
MSKIRILLTDDHTLFRQGIRTLIAAEPDMEVVGEAANASDAVALAGNTHPDVVLMDIGMTGMSSFEATRLIRKERPDTRVVFLSMYDDEDYLAECVEIGAAGYILKESPVEQLTTGIREVHRGGSYLSPRLLTRLVDDFRMQGRGGAIRQPRFGTLTKREREILKMLAEGRSVKEIATGFDLSVKTVEAHKFNLMRKLDIHNKAQLVQYAIQKKIIRLPEMAFN